MASMNRVDVGDIIAGKCPAPSVGAVNTFLTLLVESLLQAKCDIPTPDFFVPDFGPTAVQNGLETYDYVVVGAGTAGSVLASRLSEDPRVKVLVLEAGDSQAVESEVPGLLETMPQSDFLYNYFAETNSQHSQGFLGNRSYWPCGKGIGGSGATNNLMYLTGHKSDYDSWLALGNIGWGSYDLWPYFEKSTRAQVNTSLGYVEIDKIPITDRNLQNVLLNAAKELYQPTPYYFDREHFLGYARSKAFIVNGRRTSSGKGHLGKVTQQRTNIKIIKKAQVIKLNFNSNGDHLTSLDFMLNRSIRMTVPVGREAIICAGTIETPKLLMLSGIGPESHLNAFNISVVKNLPVGENLQDHVMAMVFISYNGCEKDQKDVLDSIYNYLIHNTGPAATLSLGGLTGFIKVSSWGYSNFPDIQLLHRSFNKGDKEGMGFFVRALTLNDEFRKYLIKKVSDSAILAVSVAVLHPKSRGSIKLATSSFEDAPKIEANYLAETEDMDILIRGLDYVAYFVATKSMSEINAEILKLPIPVCNQHEFKSANYWRCYVQFMTTTCGHPGGSVKMAPVTDLSGVVDSHLKVKGIDNLRVADDSIMPLIPGVCSSAPTLMIAEKAADLIKAVNIDAGAC